MSSPAYQAAIRNGVNDLHDTPLVRERSGTQQVITASEPAANDQEEVPGNDLENPLWIVACGMAFMFAALAALVAVS